MLYSSKKDTCPFISFPVCYNKIETGVKSVKVPDYLETESEPLREELRRLLAKYPAEAQVLPLSLPAGECLIHEDDPCRMVYFLMKGRVSVITNQTRVSRYMLAESAAPEFFGEYEALGNMPLYLAEVRAVTSCRLLAFPAEVYLQWMHNDTDLFFLRVNGILNSLLNQTANERNLHFLDAVDKVVQYLIRTYEKGEGSPATVRFSATRMEIAETTGNSVRTINRAVGRLAEKGLVSVKNGKLQVTAAQYEALKREMKSFLLK